MATIKELIPSDLRMSTGERLRLVASIIEADPTVWDQADWICEVGRHFPASVAETSLAESCGTPRCIAGWAVTVAPLDVVARVDADAVAKALQGEGSYNVSWVAAGCAVLGLTPRLGEALFMDTTNDDTWLPDALRTLADLPEPRSLDDAIAAGIDQLGGDYA